MKKLLLGTMLMLLGLTLYAAEGYKVIKVVDGDIIEVEYEGKNENVRLIGIDSPANKPNKQALRDAKRSGRSNKDIKAVVKLGKKAYKFTRSLVKEGDTVRIVLDVQERDREKRLLGYVYLKDGRMLNEEILRAGYANPMIIPPNMRNRARFQELYEEAKEQKKGFWK